MYSFGASAEARRHLLLLLNEDSVSHFLLAMDARTIASLFACCSRLTRRLAELGPIWRGLLERLVRDRAYTPLACRMALQPRGEFKFDLKAVYRHACVDARRTYMHSGEISQFVWSFRFKREAGQTWRRLDPWWRRTGPALQVRFLRDVDSVGPTLAEGPPPKFRWHMQARAGSSDPQFSGSRPRGSFIRMTSPWGGFPTLVCRRAPNWGFVLESCWALYTAFPMPARGEDFALEDESTVTGAMQGADISAYNGDEDGDTSEVSEDEDGEEEEHGESERLYSDVPSEASSLMS